MVDHLQEDFVGAVNAATNGVGADVVFDPVGGDVYERSVQCTASGGRLLAVGFAAGSWGRPDAGQLVLRNCAALGVYVGAHGHEEMLIAHARLCELFRDQRLGADTLTVVPFVQTLEGMSTLAARQSLGKLVVSL